jgi:predicted phosphodiesterase
MGHIIKTRFKVLTVIVLILTACTKPEDSAVTANQRFTQSLDWNNSNPYRVLTVPTDDYLIMAMGDSHVGGTNNLDKFCKTAKMQNAAGVIMAGDLTSGHRKDYEVFEQHLPPQDSLATFLIAGNHDLFFNGWEEYYSRFGSSSYLFVIKTSTASDLFICLESGGGTLGDRQLGWLINILKTMRSGYRHCIVFTHVNLFRPRHTESTNPLTEEVQVLLELFTKYNVDMVVTGHDHKKDSEVFGRTTYIIMDPLKDESENAGYFQIRLKDANIEYEFENF